MEGKRKILVLDDAQDWLDVIRDCLAGEYDLTLTTDAESALADAVQSDFSLVIIDMRLGATDGIDVLRRLREIRPDLGAIVLTGYPSVDSAVNSMKGGALDYVVKGDRHLCDTLRAKVFEAISKEPPYGSTARSRDDAIISLISQGEGAQLEFKSSARWDIKERKHNKDRERVVVRTVAAFLNSENGGSLLIGVDDAGTVLGLDEDYRTLGKKKDRDGYENFLTSLLLEACGKECVPLIRISFHRVGGKELCQIAVSPSPKPVFTKEEKGENMYVRANNSTRGLSTREALEYCKIRWKWHVGPK